MTNTYTFGFIGCGHMGGALATAVRARCPEARLILCNRTPDKAVALAEALRGTAAENDAAARHSDFLFLGVKPQMMADMLRDLRPALEARETPCVLVTMAAGLSMAAVRKMAGVDFPIIRIMPNLPASIGEGTVLVCADGVDEATLADFREALSGAGVVDDIDERLFDAAAALSGCGPAFAALLMEALEDGAVACGVPRAKARLYAAQTLRGTASLILQNGLHPAQLKDAVCSPGGTTIQGVRELEAGGFRSSAFEAVVAAYERTLELARPKS